MNKLIKAFGLLILLPLASLLLAALLLLPMGCSAADPLDEAVYNEAGYYYWNGTEWINTNEHHAEHENGGSDEIDVTGLSGLLADNQTPSAHASIHEFGASDELNIKDLLTIKQYEYYAYTGQGGLYTGTRTGGRGDVGSNYLCLYATTGNVAGDEAGVVAWTGAFYDYTWSLGRWRWSAYMTSQSNSSNMEAWFGWFSNNTTYPTSTSNHIAFHQKTDGKIYASNGNGTSGTETYLIDHAGTWHAMAIAFKYMEDDLRFYYNADLHATHTTNRPYNVFLYPGIWVKTSNGTVFSAYQYGTHFLRAPE